MTTISPQDQDDARLTAYALGELPQDERADIDRLLASGFPAAMAARTEVARIRELGVLVTRGLASELADRNVPALSAAQRAAIARASRPPRTVPWRILGAAACAGLAALLMILIGVPDSTGPASVPPPVASAPAGTAPATTAIDQVSQSAPIVARREERASVEQADRGAFDAKPALAAKTQAPARKDAAAPLLQARQRESLAQDAAGGAVGDQDAVAVTTADVNKKVSPARAQLRDSDLKTAGAAGHASSAVTGSAVAAPATPMAAAAAPSPASPLWPALDLGAPDVRPALADQPAAALLKHTNAVDRRAAQLESTTDAPAPGATAGVVAGAWRSVSADPSEDGLVVPTAREPRAAVPLTIGSATVATIRRFLAAGRLPPPAAVDLADLINAVPGQPVDPSPGESVAVAIETEPCPWDAQHQLASIRLQAHNPGPSAIVHAASNVVLLIDVSAAMQGDDRLALIKRGAQRLLERLERRDRLTILTVADQVQVLGEHSEVASGTEMPAAIDALSASGGADLGSGLARAGAIVRAHFSPTGSNSVVLCTAGTAIRAKDDQDALVATARGLARDGIALRIMAVGSDHTEDGTLEQLAHQRFGTCAFLATIPEAEQQLSAVLRAPSEVVAHAATMQVAFDPARISAYRLLGMYPAEPGARPTASVDLIDQDQVVALVELVWASDGNVANAKAVDGTAAADKRPLAEKQLVPALMTVTVQYQDRSGRPHAPIIASLADGGLRRPEQGDLPLLAAMAEFGLALRHPDDRRFSWARIQQEVRSAASADSVVTNALLDAIRRAAAVSSMPPRP